MNYTITTTREAVIRETIQQEIEAESLEEALDVAHELASLEPTELYASRWAITERDYLKIDNIDCSLDEVT